MLCNKLAAYFVVSLGIVSMSALMVLIVSAGTDVLSLSLSAADGELHPLLIVARISMITGIIAVLIIKGI